MARFKITNITKSSLSKDSVSVFFSVGVPNGYDVFSAALSFTQKFTSLSPNSGSVGGSIIRATVPGVGSADTDIDLVDSTGASIC
mmetsp:Transcript_41643/g.63613  ORF Transcript_41643/g.63613 Transcript_41643/m.63613 type:complete len:85 (+) Transcript_41643:2985-3239(+)